MRQPRPATEQTMHLAFALTVCTAALAPQSALALGHATTEAVVKLQFQNAGDAEVKYFAPTFSGTMSGEGNHQESIEPYEGFSDTLFSAQFFADALADAPPTSWSRATNALKTTVLATASNKTDHDLAFKLDAFYDISVYMAADSYSWAKTSYGLNIVGAYSANPSEAAVNIFKTRVSSSTAEPHEAVEKFFTVLLKPGETFTVTNKGAVVGAAAYSSLVPEPSAPALALAGLAMAWRHTRAKARRQLPKTRQAERP